jgi:hypothetical protein
MAIERHFDHALLRESLVCLSLQAEGVVETAGRRCLRVRASPRPGALLWPHWLPCGADEFEFHADPAHGVLLHVSGRHKGEVFELSEALEVAFDEPLDESLFAASPGLAESIRSAEAMVERMTLAEAASWAPFVVLAPSRLPESIVGFVEAMGRPPGRRSAKPRLTLMWQGQHKLWIDEAAGPEPDIADIEWEEIERDGLRMLLSDPGPKAAIRVIALERHGTHATIFSDLDRGSLIELAASLAPAP